MNSQPEFDFLQELQNLHVRIPLLQALKELLIYAKIVRYLCIKKPGRKPKDPATIHVMGKLFELMSAQTLLTKYNDLRNPMITIYINDQPIANILIDLGAAIDVMTKDLFTALGSRVKREGMLEDIEITIDSWRHPTDFIILQPETNLGGQPLILGRPWLATADVFIRCISGSMMISDGQATKNLSLYPQNPNMYVYNPWWDEFKPKSDLSLPLLTLRKAQYLKDEI